MQGLHPAGIKCSPRPVYITTSLTARSQHEGGNSEQHDSCVEKFTLNVDERKPFPEQDIAC